MKLAATVLENIENRRVFAEVGGMIWCNRSRKAMENGVVYMQYVDWVSELGGVPVVVCGENGGLGFKVNTEDEGFERLIGGKS